MFFNELMNEIRCFTAIISINYSDQIKAKNNENLHFLLT